jgi:hypothetical protein
MSSTGIVIAGFGDNEYLPSFHNYNCYGFLLNNFLSKKIKTGSVSMDRQSWIEPFAQNSMINTFMLGFSPDVYATVNDELKVCLEAFAEKIKVALQAQAINGLDAMVSAAMQSHEDAWTEAALRAHGYPLRDVMGSLPVDEMAELAETLIMLQSLKEKITQNTETVSGPVSVAVITRGDGFVWIKRKHYFDPKLNPRFFIRQGLRVPGN